MSSKNVKIAQPYAEAFLDLFNKSSLENVINDLNILTSAISGSEELKTLLSNPLINSDKKKSVIESLFRGKIENRT
jgi:F0F1-type ATP synthase delta subunit